MDSSFSEESGDDFLDPNKEITTKASDGKSSPIEATGNRQKDGFNLEKTKIDKRLVSVKLVVKMEDEKKNIRDYEECVNEIPVNSDEKRIAMTGKIKSINVRTSSDTEEFPYKIPVKSDEERIVKKKGMKGNHISTSSDTEEFSHEIRLNSDKVAKRSKTNATLQTSDSEENKPLAKGLTSKDEIITITTTADEDDDVMSCKNGSTSSVTVEFARETSQSFSCNSDETESFTKLAANGSLADGDKILIITTEEDERSDKNGSASSTTIEFQHEIPPKSKKESADQSKEHVSDDGEASIQLKSKESSTEDEELLENVQKKKCSKNQIGAKHRRSSKSPKKDSNSECPSEPKKKESSSEGDEPLANVRKQKKSATNQIRNKRKRSSNSPMKDFDLECSSETKKKESSEDDDEPLANVQKQKTTHAKNQIGAKRKRSSHSPMKDSDLDCSPETKKKESSSEDDDDEPLANMRKEKKTSAKTQIGVKRRRPSNSSVEHSDSECSSESKMKDADSVPQKRMKKSDQNEPKSSKKVQKRTESSKGDDPKILRMKRYIWAAGLRLKYVSLFENCKSTKSKVQKIQNALEDAGLKGKPTLDKCKRLKKKREQKKELAELDLDNILKDEPRTRRRTGDPFDSWPSPSRTTHRSQPADDHTKRAFSRLKGIVDSDESSE